MKTGKTLTELAQSLEYIKTNAKDYVAPITKLNAEVIDGKTVLTMANGVRQSFTPSNWAHGQLATYADIPKAYYEKLSSENPQLLADNINHGLEILPKEENRMLRTVGTGLRAFVSSKYRRFDSYDLATTTFPTLIENQFEVVSSEITDKRFYIKAVTKRIETEIKKGDAVNYGIMISSSDVGAGSLRVEPLVYRLVCLNGLIMDTAIRKYHVGRDQSESDVYELLSDTTKDLTDAAFWAQVNDIILASMKPERFEREVNKLRLSAELPITNYDLNNVVELSMRSVGVSGEQTKNSIVGYLANGANGAGLTQWGLINGFTYAAQSEHVNYDQSVDLERAGAKLLNLNANQWKSIATATA